MRFSRLVYLDCLRGVVMILMALDHASIIYNPGRVALDSVLTYPPGTDLPLLQFAMRWVTHLAAPSFVFLTGTALALRVEQTRQAGLSLPKLDRFVVKRGLLIAAIDLLLVPLFAPRWNLQVMYAIGLSLVLMVPLRRLPPSVLLVGVGLWFIGGEAITLLWWPPEGEYGSFWAGLFLTTWRGSKLIVLYPLFPWLAVMVLGWLAGRFWTSDRYTDHDRQQVLLLLGVLGLSLFGVVRRLNGYGNMLLLRADASFVQWLHVSKYPPSVSFLLLELGLMGIALAAFLRHRDYFEKRSNHPLLVFGQTPLFFYLAHIPILLLPFALHAWPRHGGLATALAATLLALILLYPLCRWFRAYRQQHAKSWVRYL